MRYELRPMGIADVLDGAFKLYRDNFRVFVGVAAVVYVPLVLLSYPLTLPPEQLQAPPPAWFIWLAVYVGIAMLGYFVQSAALTAVVADVYLGRATGVGVAYKRMWAVFASLFLAALVVAVAIALFAGVPAALAGVVAAMGSPLFSFVLILACVVFGIWLALRWMLYSQAIIVEGASAGVSLRRSALLTQGVKGRLIVLTLILGLISFAFALALGALLPASVEGIPILGQLLAQAPQLLLAPLSAAVYALVYFDARIRKEGFDLTILSREILGETK